MAVTILVPALIALLVWGPPDADKAEKNLRMVIEHMPGRLDERKLNEILKRAAEKPAATAKILLQYSHSNKTEQKKAAIVALGELPPSPAGEKRLLEIVADDPSTDLRALAALSLGRHRSRPSVYPLVRIVSGRTQEAFSSRTLKLRQNAALALAAIGDPQTATQLLKAIQIDRMNRSALALALTGVGEHLALQQVLPLLGSKAEDVRHLGTLLLGCNLDGAASKHLQKALRDRSLVVRKAATIALGKLGRPDAVPSLKKSLLHDRSEVVRKAAQTALSRFPDFRQNPPVQSHLPSAQLEVERAWFNELSTGFVAERLIPRRGRGTRGPSAGGLAAGGSQGRGTGAPSRPGQGQAGSGGGSGTSGGGSGSGSGGTPSSGTAGASSGSSGNSGASGDYRGPSAQSPAEGGSQAGPGEAAGGEMTSSSPGLESGASPGEASSGSNGGSDAGTSARTDRDGASTDSKSESGEWTLDQEIAKLLRRAQLADFR